MNQHLSAQDISAWLAGDRTQEHDRHVRECAECQAALDGRVRSLARFSGALKDWSSQQFPPVRPIRERRYGFGGLRLAAATLALAVLAAIPVHLRHRAAERDAEIARQDEALLQQVQTEVSRSVPEPMEPLTSLWTTNTRTTNGTTESRP